MQLFAQRRIQISVNKLSNQKRQFMCILTNCWYANCAIPVPIKVAKSKSQFLKLIGRHIQLIVYDIVISWCNGRLTFLCWYHIEVISAEDLFFISLLFLSLYK